jgi:hypothetical protein
MASRSVVRALVVLLCVALVVSLALDLSGAQLQWVVVAPILTAFAFPSLPAQIPPALPVRLQPVSLLSIDASRAPPLFN